MTAGEAYRAGRKLLEQSGCDAPSFDADCLFEKAFGMSRQGRIINSAAEAEEEKTQAYLSLAQQRAEGRPLQYLLGEWPFFGMTLSVGEGVLIPREETELLVREAARLLSGKETPAILDLCSGTGAVALALAGLFPGARVTAAEKYDAAFSYLKQNTARTGRGNVTAVQLDLFDRAAAARFPEQDLIVCNPPYIRSGEIPGLQAEVRREPREALDGGADGLDFYRALAELWLPRLLPDGAVAAEIGEDQAEAVRGIFAERLTDLRTLRDFSDLPRVVSGRRCCFSGEKHL